jgi:hypothetical protein
MNELIQIMRFATDEFDTVAKLTEQYRTDTEGRATFTNDVVGRDLETGEYVVIVTFPSREAADVNDAPPETAKLAADVVGLTSGGVAFSNVEVLTG